MLEHSPDDVVTLDKVALSLVALGGKENAEKALKYARVFQDLIEGMQPPAGADAPQIQEERDRAEARTLMTQARVELSWLFGMDHDEFFWKEWTDEYKNLPAFAAARVRARFFPKRMSSCRCSAACSRVIR